MDKSNRTCLLLGIITLLAALALAACNAPMPASSATQADPSPLPPTGASATSAPPLGVTFTPITTGEALPTVTSTITLTPDPDCGRIQFLEDVTYPDDANIDAEQVITKTWRVRNVGTCAWDSSYRLVFVRGDQMEGTSPAEIITTPVEPNTNTEISIELTMPNVNGYYWGVWQIVNGAGVPLRKADGSNQELSILINVKNGTGGKVTSVRTVSYFFEGVKCTNNVQYEMTMSIYVDNPVSVGYTWSTTSGVLEVVSATHTFTGAGNIQVTTRINPPFADPNNVRVTLTANGVSNSYTICP